MKDYFDGARGIIIGTAIGVIIWIVAVLWWLNF